MENVVDTLIATVSAQLAQGTVPWRKPWESGHCPSEPRRADGVPFSGFNAIMLAIVAASSGYRSATWMTYKQAEAHGGQVRRGEKATPAILYKTRVKDDGQGSDAGDASGDGGGKVLRFLRNYSVFSAEQIDGLADNFYAPQPVCPIQSGVIPTEIAAVPATVIYDGSEAAYYPTADVIRLPRPSDFRSHEDHVAIRCHESVHWTGHASRLDRGLEQYHLDHSVRAAEELVAELGTMLMSMRLGLPMSQDLLDNHGAYIASWAKSLEDTPSALLKAAGQAQKAVDHLLSYSAAASAHADKAAA